MDFLGLGVVYIQNVNMSQNIPCQHKSYCTLNLISILNT